LSGRGRFTSGRAKESDEWTAGKAKSALFAVLLVFAVLVLLSSRPSPVTPVFRPIFVLLFLLVPLLTIYSIARYFEYSCDREAIKFTNDPEAGLQALVNLYRMTGSPITCSRIGEVFMTHPSLTDRLEAIARAAEIVLSRASAVLIEEGLQSH